MPANSEVAVALPEGVALHARPAGAFVKTALKFQSTVTVASNGKRANAKSNEDFDQHPTKILEVLEK